MLIGNNHFRFMCMSGQVHPDIKLFHPFLQKAGTESFFKEFLCFCDILIRYLYQYLQFPARIASDQPQQGRRFYAMHSPGIRDCYAFYIFNYIPAAMDRHLFRKFAQHFSRFCRRKGKGNWFCASQSRNKLFPQDFQIIPINRIIHSVFPVFLFIC